jgi:hypothetical protein
MNSCRLKSRVKLDYLKDGLVLNRAHRTDKQSALPMRTDAMQCNTTQDEDRRKDYGSKEKKRKTG